METDFERSRIEKWADEFQADFKRYVQGDDYKKQATGNIQLKIFEDVLLNRIAVSEIAFEVWIKDMVTGSQAMYEKENMSKEAIGKIMTEFSRKITAYEIEKRGIKALPDEN